MSKWHSVAKIEEISNQSCKLIDIDDTPIAVFNLDGEFCAIKDDCPHQHLPIADGLIENCNITCPYHGARFNLKTGQLLAPPACENLTTYPTRVVDGIIEIQL